MPDTPRPGHNHPLDSLCLVIACPRGAYDAGKRAHIDALTAADEEDRQTYYARGLHDGARIRQAFAIVTNLRDDEIDDFARRVIEADSKTARAILRGGE